MEAADMKEIERVATGESEGGIRISVDSAAFSGMEKKDGIPYLFHSR